jgi:putative intracellular protease/amidase
VGDGYVQKVTGFSNSEEEAVGKTKYVPFLLEDKLKELGGLYERGPDWQPFAVADGKLVLGQNPASSAEVAKLVLAAI